MESLETDVLYRRIVEILADELCVRQDSIDKESLIFEQLGADSMDAISIVMRLEREFKIEIPDAQIPSFRTPDSIVRGIQSYFSGGNACS
jgi:acyl carrier protein